MADETPFHLPKNPTLGQINKERVRLIRANQTTAGEKLALSYEETPLQILQKKCLVKWKPLVFVPLQAVEGQDLHDPIITAREPFVSQEVRQTHEYQASVKWPGQGASQENSAGREPSTVHKRTRRNWAETSTVNQIAYKEAKAKSTITPRQRHMITAVYEEGHTRKKAGAQIDLKPSQAGSLAKEAAEAMWAALTADGKIKSS